MFVVDCLNRDNRLVNKIKYKYNLGSLSTWEKQKEHLIIARRSIREKLDKATTLSSTNNSHSLSRSKKYCSSNTHRSHLLGTKII